MIDRSSNRGIRGSDLFILGVIAFVPRLITILAVSDLGLFSDMFEYHERAEILVRDLQFNFDSWRGPGYPLFLALLYLLPFPDLLTARLANAVLGGVSAALTCVLASRFVERRHAVAAGVIVALYPALVLSSVYVMPEGLYSCLMLGALIVAEKPRLFNGICAGVLAGYAALTRSLGTSLIPAVVGGTFLYSWLGGTWRRHIASSACLVAAFMLTVTPWFMHTRRVSGGLMFDSASGFNMLAGNNPRATGRLEIPDGDWIFATYFADTPSEAARNERALTHSVDWILTNPMPWLRLIPTKIGYLWGLEGREHVWVYSNSYFGPLRTLTVWAWGLTLLFSFPVLAIAAVVGLLRPELMTRPTGWHIVLLLAAVTGLHVLSFGESRFHLPLVPILAVLAVCAVGTRSSLTPLRIWVSAMLVAALAMGWATQAPDLVRRLLRLAMDDGWWSALMY